MNDTHTFSSLPVAGFSTDLSKSRIPLEELLPGGPAKDGIPAIDHPRFIGVTAAQQWLKPQEPVIALAGEQSAKAYPLQILIWHEMVNDHFEGQPVLVTFCPLCYSALVFGRRVGSYTLDFGVSGMLRHSDMIMYDRQTESLWQQFTGEAVVGSLTDQRLAVLPSQIMSFEQFYTQYPEGHVLSRETGFERDYGRNPYRGYDDVSQRPFRFEGETDPRLPPMEKVLGLHFNGQSKAYPYRLTRQQRVIVDQVGDQPVVIFHLDGAVSALDAGSIADSREAGTTGVFDPVHQGQMLSFEWHKGQVRDRQTGTVWSATGHGLSGPLRGQQLRLLPYGDYFAFAWLVFRPDSQVYTLNNGDEAP
ncbi:MAG: DUF3179 domain-containing protein [Candidatus Sericytochromatia bacterium]|nr:DUF3179 domain-containing protein [Candidatus Sericytochromatia bacterium]